MSQVLNFVQGHLFFNNFNAQNYGFSFPLLPHKSCFPNRKSGVQFLLQVNSKLVNHIEHSLPDNKAEACDGDELYSFPHIQTLREFPKEELFRKVVMVRFDSRILPLGKKEYQSPPASALSTIKYLHNAGAKVILVGSWSGDINLRLSSAEYVAEFLSSMLKLKVVQKKLVSRSMHSQMEYGENSDILLLENLSDFKMEIANCSKFAKELASGVDIFVNDAFSQSHKVLASTVGVACFCSACMAGFYFEEGLYQLKKIIKTTGRPYVAIIGGSNLAGKAAALLFLASKCDALVFVGSMAFQIMHAMGVPVPVKLVELGALNEAVSIVESANSRNIPIVLPKDFWCMNGVFPKQLKIFSVNSILDGWQPVDLGPLSLQEIIPLLSKCKKILCIGPLKFSSSRQEAGGVSKLAAVLGRLSQSTCDVTFVGKMASGGLLRKSTSISDDNFVKNASVVWEFLKGRNLPGLLALDRAYPFDIDWDFAYADPMQPLVVDVGSGNGLFLFGMARRRKDLNFLGLEINEKLVTRCLDHVHQSGMQNGYFITTNATSTFRSIVSSYPGGLVLVSIQCPNPDFNKPEHRWRMLQRSLVEAIADLLTFGGKVFFQSDIEAVAMRMKREFIEYGKGKLVIVHDSEIDSIHQRGWLTENPFGVRSDWEQHVLDRVVFGEVCLWCSGYLSFFELFKWCFRHSLLKEVGKPEQNDRTNRRKVQQKFFFISNRIFFPLSPPSYSFSAPYTRVHPRQRLAISPLAKEHQPSISFLLIQIRSVLELAGNAARDNKKNRIIPRHVLLAVRNDEELGKLLQGVTIAYGGVLPNINPVLLLKKTGGDKATKEPKSPSKATKSPKKAAA
ncbi:Phosphoglycerate kinase [Abeliophyllum distichum]|uniref:Phosphoglycerate kinase n=1 Tax=Abeliophyllum distichum TaxID=126358 RepID=A0ABD1RG43_9LAMI